MRGNSRGAGAGFAGRTAARCEGLFRPAPAFATALAVCALAGARCTTTGVGQTGVATPAEAFFDLGNDDAAFPDGSGVIAHYEEYLERFGDQAGPDLQVRALVRIAEAHHDRARCAPDATEEQSAACRTELEQALEYARRALGVIGLPATGADEALEFDDPVAARNAFRERTLAALRAAVEPHVEGDSAEARQARIDLRTDLLADALGQARFYAGEGRYESFMAGKLPAFDPAVGDAPTAACAQFAGNAQFEELCLAAEKYRIWSELVYAPYVTAQSDLLAEVQGFWNAIAFLDTPQWEVAAASRLGDMLRRFWEDLAGGAVPPAFDRPEFADVAAMYAEQLDLQAEPYKQKAVEAYGYCILVARREQLRTEYAARCEESLLELDPQAAVLTE